MAEANSKPVQRDIWKDAMQSHSSFNTGMMGGTSIFTEERPTLEGLLVQGTNQDLFRYTFYYFRSMWRAYIKTTGDS